MKMKLPPELAQNILLFYASAKNAGSYAECIISDKNAPLGLKQIFKSLLSKMQYSCTHIELNIAGDKVLFNEQLKNNDLMKFDEVNRLMAQMKPDEQDFIETVAQALIKGEKIIIEQSNTY